MGILAPALVKTLRAGLFGRESKGHETSIDAQDWENEQACAEREWPIVVRYRERVSASRFGDPKARDEWAKVIAGVEAGRIDVLVLYEVSRGDRVMDTWVPFVTSCRVHGVLVHITRDETTYDPRKPGHRKALIDAGSDAEHETEKLSARSNKGIAKALRDGKMHGPVPAGYDRVYDQADRKKFTQVANEDAPVRVEIIERIATREPLLAICRDLNRRGVPTASWLGVPYRLIRWRPEMLRRVGLNPSYAGLREYNGVLYEGNWEPIVPRATWEACRAVLLEPDRRTSPPGRQRWLLSVLMVGACVLAEEELEVTGWEPEHRRVCGRPANGKRRLLDRYRCPCGCASIGVAEADEIVIRLILARLALPDARALFARDDEELAAARDELAAVEAEARELEAEVRARRLRPALAAQFDADIQERLKAAQQRVRDASGNAAALALLGDGEFIAETAWPRWQALSVVGRRSVIATVVERIILYPAISPLTRWSTEADRLRSATERIRVEWVQSDAGKRAA